MNARSRKKTLCRKLSKKFNSDQLREESTGDCCVKGWRTIKPDLMRLFGNDFAMARKWFITPAIALDNIRPRDLIAAGKLQIVREHLIRLQYGVYT